MKRFILLFVIFWMCAPLLAADASWLTSVPDAMTRAKKENKLVLLDFTGSDWCPACKILDTEILGKPEFTRYASTNLVLVMVDFPAQKPQSDALKAANEELRKKYDVDGFPTLIALKSDGKMVWHQLGYSGGGPAEVIARLEEAKKK